MMQMLRYKIALEGKSVHAYKFTRILFRPWWKNYVAELHAALFRTYLSNSERDQSKPIFT